MTRYLDPKPSADEIVAALPKIGFEVDDVEFQGVPPLEKVVVGEVLSREQHPNADRLGVCMVDTGDGNHRQIVCGATNFKVGDRVPVALPGAVLPGNFKIKASKLRGVESKGMMCSAKEIGMGSDHAGLYILDSKPDLGTPINDVLTDNDTVIELEITPDRADALCHMGIARELAGFFGCTLIYPQTQVSPGSPFRQDAESLLESVQVEDERFCPHYRAYSIRNVKVGESPSWLKQSLTAIGLRPVNNVVDVTNYVLHEIGHPMHAFDAAKIRGRKIIVRSASEGEKITTLDGKERKLAGGMGVIADAERALVVAGVMGSLDAEVDEGTTDVVLEVALFSPVRIRRASRGLGISSDSSYRYERGVDPRGAEYAAMRAIDLIREVAGGEVTGPPEVSGEEPLFEREIAVSPDWVESRLGFSIDRAAMRQRLERLEMNVQHEESPGRDRWTVSIPSFRFDLERPIDLVEEVLRVHGTEDIPAAAVVAPALDREDDPLATVVRKANRQLVADGFAECMHYTLRSQEELARWSSLANADGLALDNPLSADQSHLRTSLLFGLLDALKLNRSRFNEPRRLFETGRVFREKDGALYELLSVAFVEVRDPQPEAWQPLSPPDFYTVKGRVEELLRLAGIDSASLDWKTMRGRNAWQDQQSAQVGEYVNGFEARCGLVSLALLKAWDIDGQVLAGTLFFLPDFLRQKKPRLRYQPFSGYPPVHRDLALLVEQTTPAETVRREVKRLGQNIEGGSFALEAVRVFDLYEGEGLPEGKKSLGLSLVYRAQDRTLTDDEVNGAFNDLQKNLADDTPYLVRK